MYDDRTTGDLIMKVLALSANYEPLGVVSWERAVTLVYSDKVSVVEEYDCFVRSPSVQVKIPAVIVFKKSFISNKRNSVRFSRKNVWIRDEGKCQYCNLHVSLSTFTIDHVIPKKLGGQTMWDNVVACCYSCNQKKSDKSLKEAGFKLFKVPRKPFKLPYLQEITDGQYNLEKNIPQEWKFYLERF
jgi:5-methylcytosine-specific restriction endonuclease McrA